MLTPTPRLGLLRPEDIDEVAIEDLNHNSDILDVAPAVVSVSTNGVMPATPAQGQLCWDVIAKQLKVYQGSTWTPIYAIPPGGTDGQVLAKTSATDYAFAWRTEVPLGGSANQVLTKSSATNFAATWKTPDPAQWERGAIGFNVPAGSIVDTAVTNYGTAFTSAPYVTYGYQTNQNSAYLFVELLQATSTGLAFRIRNPNTVSNLGQIFWHATL